MSFSQRIVLLPKLWSLKILGVYFNGKKRNSVGSTKQVSVIAECWRGNALKWLTFADVLQCRPILGCAIIQVCCLRGRASSEHRLLSQPGATWLKARLTDGERFARGQSGPGGAARGVFLDTIIDSPSGRK